MAQSLDDIEKSIRAAIARFAAGLDRATEELDLAIKKIAELDRQRASESKTEQES